MGPTGRVGLTAGISPPRLQVARYDARLCVEPCDVHPWQELYGGEIRADVLVEIVGPGSDEPMEFALYRLLAVESVQTDGGRPLRFEEQARLDPWNPRRQVNCVRVRPPRKGFGSTVRFRYSGPVCGYTEVWPYARDHISTEYTLLRPECLWYPVPLGDLGRIPAGFCYSLEVQVPQPLVAICAGQLKATREEPNGWRSYLWEMARPTWKMAVAAAQFTERQVDDLPVAIYTSTVDAASVEIVADVVGRVVDWATGWLDELPGGTEGLKLVEVPPRWGSEASPGLVLQTRDSFPSAAGDAREWANAGMSAVAHELLHLWGIP